MALSIVHGSNCARILGFYEKLTTHLQLLETTEKLNTSQGYLRNMLDELHQIWSDFVKLDKYWQQLGFPKPVDVLRQCVKRNPVTEAGKTDHQFENKKFQNTSTKCHILKVYLLLRPGTQGRWPCRIQGSSQKKADSDFKEVVFQRSKVWSLRSS